MQKKLSPAQINFLVSLFGEEDVLLDREKIAIFGTDASKEFAWPSVVVRPESSKQIEELLRWANIEKIPIIPRARGTNVVGACVPVTSAVVVSTLKLNKILDIDDVDFVAEVEPGVVAGTLQQEVKKKGLFYPPDPASVNISTIGGNVAQNAGGLRAVKYGVTKDYVLGMDVVLPGGRKLKLGGRVHKDVVGLDLKSLMVGSEGTLGFFTKIILKLLPLPESSVSILVGFPSLEDLLFTAISILKNGFLPVAMEFMDKDVLLCIKEIYPLDLPEGVDCLLLLKFDGNPMEVEYCINKTEALFKELNVIFWDKGKNRKKEEELWEIRRMINPASHKMGEKKIALDICVPRSSIPKIVGISKDIGKKHSISVLTFGHLGDGNIHVNIMYSKDEEKNKAYMVAEEILRQTIALRGTISGEHGVGILKLESMKLQLDTYSIELMRKIKKVLDPNNIMNPKKAY